jgi:LPXTG-motif cell wall-anchored protein
MADFVISLFMAAGVALAFGAVVMFRRRNRKQAGLMAFAAAIMFINVAIWLVPTENGATLANPNGNGR